MGVISKMQCHQCLSGKMFASMQSVQFLNTMMWEKYKLVLRFSGMPYQIIPPQKKHWLWQYLAHNKLFFHIQLNSQSKNTPTCEDNSSTDEFKMCIPQSDNWSIIHCKCQWLCHFSNILITFVRKRADSVTDITMNDCHLCVAACGCPIRTL